MEASALAAVGILSALLVAGLPLGTRGSALAMGFGLAAGYVLADVVSGLVHWLFDRAFEETTPVLGAAFVHPFREHHSDPLAITRHGFLELNGNNALSVLPVLVIAVVIPAADGPWAVFGRAVVLGLVFGVILTNQFHQWAHTPAPARFVRWLQSHHCVLTPDAHARHHSGSHTGSYCVTTGWMNALLDRTGVFRLLERALLRLGIPGPHTEPDRPRS